MKINIWGLLCGLALNCNNLLASEVDSFTHRYDLTEDASVLLNTFTNERINRGFEEAREYLGCSESALRKSLKKHLSGNVIQGPVEEYINFNREGEIPTLRFPRNQSIYREVKFCEAPVLTIFKSAVGGIVLIDDAVVGADKFGHFFTEGLIYYKKAFVKNQDIKKVLKWGAGTEKRKYGLLTTGTYSHADLVANYKGMTFWANLIERQINAPGPYFACDRGEWKKIKEFDWRDYVDAGFDEGINCSHYTKAVGKKVAKAITQLQEKTGLPFTCPIAPGKLSALHEKYSAFASDLLYPVKK